MSIASEYAAWLNAESKRIDTSLVLQMQRMVVLTLDDVFIDLTLRTAESRRDRFEPPEPFDDDQRADPVGTGTVDDRDTLRELRMLHRRQRLSESAMSIEDVLSRSFCNVVLGDPGSGKTTLLRSLAARWAVQQIGEQGEEKTPHPSPLPAKPGRGDEEWLPVPVTLRYLAQAMTTHGDITLKKFLEDENWRSMKNADKSKCGAFGQFVLEKAEEGRCLFLLDGLDEAISADLRVRVVDAIDRLTRDFPRCRFLVTSRIVGYELAELPSSFQPWELEPFSRRQTHDFFHKWSRAIEAKQNEDGRLDEFATRRAETLKDGILNGLGIDPQKLDEASTPDPSKERLLELARNPMLCTLIGLIYYNGQAMPDARAELYRLCLEAFVFDWEIRKRTLDIERQSLNKFETIDVLEELAFQLHKGGEVGTGSSNCLSMDCITRITRQFLIEEKGYPEALATERTEHLVQLIHGRAGLLIERGEEEFGFAHLQFQEYLSGRALVRRSRDIRSLLDQYLWVGRWQEPIVLAAAHRASHSEEAASEFIEAILDTKPPFNDDQPGPFERPVPDLEVILHHALFVAAQSWNDAQRVHHRTRVRIADEIRFLFADRLHFYLWDRAIHALGRMASQVDSAPLLDAVRNDQDGYVRWSAAQALGAARAESSVGSLLDVLRNDQQVYMRESAAYALGEIRSESAVGPLDHALLNDQHPEVRWRAAYALGAIGAKPSIGTLLNALRNDQDEYVRWRAADALVALGEFGPESVGPLLVALRNDQDEFARRGAAVALGAIRADSSIAPLIDALRSDQSESVRGSAVNALGAIRAESSVGPLLDALRTEQNADIRRNAAIALGAIRAESAIGSLLDAFRGDPEMEVRWSAAKALGAIRVDSSVGPLIDALRNDQDGSVRVRAAAALMAIGSESSVGPLLDALRNDANDTVRGRAAAALGAIGSESSVGPLLDALQNDANDEVRGRAATALGAIRSRDAATGLLHEILNMQNDDWLRGSCDAALREVLFG